MKKIILGISLLFNFSFSQPYIKDGIKAGEDISKFDLSLFTKGNSNNYKIGSGDIYEKNIIYKNKEMKEVYLFKKNKLSFIFIYDKEDQNPIDIEIEEKGNIKFVKGYIKTDENEEQFNYKEKNDYYGMLNVKLNEILSSMSKNILFNTTYAKKFNNKETKKEDFYGITVLKTCYLEEKHKECKSCEFIEGKTKIVSCNTLYINHVLK